MTCCEEILIRQDFGIPGIVDSFSGGTTGLTPNVPTTGNIVLGGTLNIANGGTGATTATTALTNLGIPTFSILNYGAVPDGDGQGGGTNNEAAFDATVAAVKAAGGGVMWVPPGIYRKDGGTLIDFSDIQVKIDGFVDLTNAPGNYAFRVLGSAGTAVNFNTSPKTIGDTVIQADADATRVVGAPVKLISTLVCNSTDPDAIYPNGEWNLGRFDGSTRIYFGEWHSIKAINSATEFVIDRPLQFPGYNLTATGTYGLRTCSTVQVPAFVENVNFSGSGGFISYAETQTGGPSLTACVWFEWCRNVSISGLMFDATLNAGQLYQFRNCVNFRALGVRGKHAGNLDLSSFDHNLYNLGKFNDCTGGYLEYFDTNGSQGNDDTYRDGGILNYDNVVVAHSVRNLNQGATSHGVCYNHTYRVYDSGSRQAIMSRARYADIEVYGGGSNDAGSGFVQLFGHGCINATVRGRIDGCALGVEMQRDEISTPAPATWNSQISAIFDNCATAIRTFPSATSPTTTLPSNLTIKGGEFNNCARVYTGGAYINRVSFVANTVNGLNTTSGFVLVFDPNSVEHVMLANVCNNIGASNSFYRQTAISDTTTFPTATYPNNRAQYDGILPTGSYLGDTSGAGAVAANTITAATYTVTSLDFAIGRILVCNRSTAMTITLPQFSDLGTSGFSTRLRVYNIGAGTVTFAAGTGATLESPNGVTLVGAGTQCLLTKRSGSIWRLWKGGNGNDLTIWDYGADGLGGATDLAALDAMLAALIAGLPKLPDWAEGPINVGLLIPGPANTDPMPYLQKIYTAFDRAELWSAKFDYTSIREWNFPTRPSTGLGPQGQYLTPPQESTHEWRGATWDFSAMSSHSGSADFMRRECSFGTAVAVTSGITGGSTVTIPVTPGMGTSFPPRSRVLLRATAGFDDLALGAYTLNDAEGVPITGQVSGGTTLTVSVASSGSIQIGSQITDGGIAANTYVTAFLTGTGGTGTYTITPSQPDVGPASMLSWRGHNVKADDLIVKENAANSVTVFAPPEYDYPTGAAPVLQLYQNEPKIKLINPSAIGPGRTVLGSNQDHFFFISGGRNFQMEGGRLRNFGGRSFRLLSVMGGSIRDYEWIGPVYAGDANSGASAVIIYDNTTDFLVQNCTSWGGFQPWIYSGSNYLWGVTRRVVMEDITSYSAAGSFSTHNLSEQLTWKNCTSFNATQSAFDIRCRRSTVLDCTVNDGASNALFFRLAPNGLLVDGFTVNTALSGIVLEDSGSPAWEDIPGDLTFRNLRLNNIGGVGSLGAIAMSYSQTVSGVRPTLGALIIENAALTMNDNTNAVEIGGKWTAPQVDFVASAADGASPAGRAIRMDGAGGGVGMGPINPVITLSQSGTYTVPFYADFTGQITTGATILGVTSTRAYITPTTPASPLINEQGLTPRSSGEFANNGATGLVIFTLPPASSTLVRRYRFIVSNSNGIQVASVGDDTIQIANGAAGAAPGTITSTTVGAICELESISSTQWIAWTNNDVLWTVA